MSSMQSNEKKQLIHIQSTDVSLLLPSIALVFNGDTRVNSFERFGNKFTFYKSNGYIPCSDFDANLTHNMLVNYLAVQEELKKQNGTFYGDFYFELEVSNELESVFSIIFHHV